MQQHAVQHGHGAHQLRHLKGPYQLSGVIIAQPPARTATAPAQDQNRLLIATGHA
jgi:hypothetical protein